MKNLNKIIAVFLIFGMIGFNSCKKQEIVKIVGFVQGHAFDGNTDQPLDSVKVAWTVAGKKDSTTATAEDGYLISNLLAGEYTIWFSKTNYTTIAYDAWVYDEGSAGNVTVRGGANKEMVLTYNPNLYPLNGSVSGRLYITENGLNVPAAGAEVQLDYNRADKEDDEYYRFVPGLYTTTTDADGYYTFTNIPATEVILRFLDYTDGNGETYYDPSYHTTNYRRIYLTGGASYTHPNVTLSMVDDGISLIASNLFSATNVGTQNFDVTSDITLTFNKNVDMANTEDMGYVRLEIGNVEIEADITYADNMITINPTQDLAANTTYTVDYNVYGAQTYDNTGGQTITFSTSDDATVPAQVTGFDVAKSAGYMGVGWEADYNTTNIWFEFNRITNALAYEVYAKDDYNNPEYSLIGTFNQSDYLQGLFHASTNLPSKFDYYEDDAVQTPFSHGTTVTYKVRAINSAGAGPFSTEIPVTDETSFGPTDIDISNTQSASTDNSLGGTPLTITMTFSINIGRYADVSDIPNVTIWDGVSESTPTQTITWVDHQSGIIEFDVPAGVSYVGYTIRLHGITDSSGNTMAAGDYEIESLY